MKEIDCKKSHPVAFELAISGTSVEILSIGPLSQVVEDPETDSKSPIHILDYLWMS